MANPSKIILIFVVLAISLSVMYGAGNCQAKDGIGTASVGAVPVLSGISVASELGDIGIVEDVGTSSQLVSNADDLGTSLETDFADPSAGGDIGADQEAQDSDGGDVGIFR